MKVTGRDDVRHQRLESVPLGLAPLGVGMPHRCVSWKPSLTSADVIKRIGVYAIE